MGKAEQIAEGRPSKPFTPTQMNENTTTSDPSTAAALPTAPGSAAGSFGSEGWADTIDKAASMVYQYANLRAMNAGRVQDRLVREMADLMMLRADLLTIRDTLRAQPNAKLSHPAPNLQQPKPMSENLPTSPTPRELGCAPATCSACLDLRSALRESEEAGLHLLAMETERQNELVKALGVDPTRDVWLCCTRQERHNVILNMILELRPNRELSHPASEPSTAKTNV